MKSKRIVIKIGTNVLHLSNGKLDYKLISELATQIAFIRAHGHEVLVVSSGAVGAGRELCSVDESSNTLTSHQILASVGQARLIQIYAEAFRKHNTTVAQILVTLEDSSDRRRYLNSRATLGQLLQYGVVPIVNENDTVATDEIRYGDNDRLAAQIAVTIGADCLVLLSDVDGFYSANPSHDNSAVRFDTIEEISPEIEAMAGDAGTDLSKGGMITKLMAAKMAMGAGCAMAITLGSPLNPLQQLLDGANATWFLPKVDPTTARKKWISSLKPNGSVVLDEGAVRALKTGKSLLPAGVTTLNGIFSRGELVRILTLEGEDLGCGLIAFDSVEALQILGCHTKDVEVLLGYASRGALIHRDDMVLQG